MALFLSFSGKDKGYQGVLYAYISDIIQLVLYNKIQALSLSILGFQIGVNE